MNSPTGEAINTGLTFLQTIAPFYLLLAFKLTSDGLMRGCGMMGRLWQPPFRPVPARGAGHPVFQLAGRERHLAVLACGLVCGHRALHGVLSYLYLPAGRRKNDAVTFLTWVKALHFTMKQSEQNEKITKNDTVFLVAFT